MGITKKQIEILNFIEKYQKENNGISPSLIEIKNHFKLKAVSTVFGHLERLKKEGYIEKEWNSKRGIKIKRDENLKKVPFLGVVSAGCPIEVIEDKEYIDVPSYLVSSGENYILKVSGNSMVEDGIFDGDLIVISKKERAENGDLVIALVNEEVTLKRFFRERDRIILKPANSNYKPIVVKEDEVKIQGIVLGLIRKYK